MRSRRAARRPPDLTSLFDVLFIVVFAALIRAAAVQHAAAPAPTPAAPAPPAPPPEVAELRQRALAALANDLAARTPLVVRISRDATIEAIEVAGRRVPLDAPLLERSADPDAVVTYLGERSADLRICRLAALHLGVAQLSQYLVIMAPAIPLADLPHALYDGLHRDVDRCLAEQHGLAALVDPAAVTPAPTSPKGTP